MSDCIHLQFYIINFLSKKIYKKIKKQDNSRSSLLHFYNTYSPTHTTSMRPTATDTPTMTPAFDVGSFGRIGAIFVDATDMLAAKTKSKDYIYKLRLLKSV